MHSKSSIDQNELNKFNKTEQEWWDLQGEFKALHEINPIRIEYINSVIHKHFKNITSLKLLDIGCGGGIACASMCKLGFDITGLDANEHNIKAAKSYVARNKLNINYINITVEDYIKQNDKYDVIMCLEVIEHVANPKEFVLNISKLLKPNGILIFSTINRTKKAYLFTIIMAEYILKWLPKHTHDYSKFIKPSEFVNMLADSNLNLQELKGLSMHSFPNGWSLSDDIDVNYFAVFSS